MLRALFIDKQTVKGGARAPEIEKRSERRSQNFAGAQAGAPLRF